jgi:DNA-binding protein Fis
VAADRATLAKTPLAVLVRERLQVLLDELGSHRTPDLYRRVLSEVERALILEALDRAGGSRKQAAELLGIHRNTLRNRMRQLSIGRRKG